MKDNSKRKKWKFAKRISSSIARLTGIEVVTWFLYEGKRRWILKFLLSKSVHDLVFDSPTSPLKTAFSKSFPTLKYISSDQAERAQNLKTDVSLGNSFWHMFGVWIICRMSGMVRTLDKVLTVRKLSQFPPVSLLEASAPPFPLAIRLHRHPRLKRGR